MEDAASPLVCSRYTAAAVTLGTVWISKYLYKRGGDQSLSAHSSESRVVFTGQTSVPNGDNDSSDCIFSKRPSACLALGVP
jgi:hypothetical protein